jgi:hypothetical protein
MHVESVEERAGNTRAIALRLSKRATAVPGRVAQMAAGARVHSGDELEFRGIISVCSGARDSHDARLQRLAQSLKDSAVELRQLVEDYSQ